MAMTFNEAALVKEYTPIMVLYPEIPAGSLRERNPNYPHESPILYDYHPRDVRIVLEHSGLHHRFRPWKGGICKWEEMLDRMETAHYRKDLDLLPGVALENRKEFWKAYAAISKDKEYYQRACYARVVPGSGINSDRILLQYWYAYFYNDFWNTHEMDWETVMLVFKLANNGPRPTVCAYSAHFGGHWLPWSEVEKVNTEFKQVPGCTHPVVYVANGSHANYFYGPAQYRTAPELIAQAAQRLKKKKRGLVDYTTSFEDGEPYLVEAKLIPPDQDSRWTGDWRWLNQQGKWGSPGDWDLEFGDSGPYGPPQGGDRWDHPFRWIVGQCTRAPSQAESLVPTRLEPQ
jgi:hypothetical protein